MDYSNWWDRLHSTVRECEGEWGGGRGEGGRERGGGGEEREGEGGGVGGGRTCEEGDCTEEGGVGRGRGGAGEQQL